MDAASKSYVAVSGKGIFEPGDDERLAFFENQDDAAILCRINRLGRHGKSSTFGENLDDDFANVKYLAATITMAANGRGRLANKHKNLDIEWHEIEDFCQVCDGTDTGHSNDILLCDGEGCNKGYHQACLRPKVKVAPEGEWLCPDCAT